MRYGTILADPPWAFKCWSDKENVRTASHHYKTQPTSWLESLPVEEVAAPDCVLFLWSVFTHLPDALRVIDAWGFTYKTVGFTWVKPTKADPTAYKFGLGYWTRANAEICLLATRGKPRRVQKNVGQIIAAPIGRHSEKPDEQYSRIERLVPGPYLEMFARSRRDGWTSIGNEITGNDIADDLRTLSVLRLEESAPLVPAEGVSVCLSS